MPCTMDHPVPHLKKKIKMKNSIMRKLMIHKDLYDQPYPLCTKMQLLGWPPCGMVSSAGWGWELPKLFLLKQIPFPRKCISCPTRFTPCFGRNGLSDDCLKLIWFPAPAIIGLAVEIQCWELNTPLFSEQELGSAAYWSFSCPRASHIFCIFKIPFAWPKLANRVLATV